MKRTISIAAAAILATVVLGSCGYKSKIAKQEKELKQLRADKEALDAVLSERDMTVNKMINDFDEIEKNLAEIKTKENIISAKTTGGIERNRKAEIVADINALHALVNESRAKVDALDKKLAGTNWQLSVFQKKLDELKVQLDERDKELIALKDVLSQKDEQIARLFTQVDTLTVHVAVQEGVIKQQDKELHTAYYRTGTYKELRDEGIITAQGGVLGLGKAHDVGDHFAKEHFSEIDIRELTYIALNAKKATILSEHPSGSYRFEMGNDMVKALVISDPAEFWKASRYLVIEVKGQQGGYDAAAM